MFGALVAAVALFAGLAVIGLIGPDEARYAWIAREMARTHDWITPRLYGQPWFEKPVLYYWAAGLGFKLFRSPEWASRIPSAAAALLAALSIAWLGLKHYGEKTAWLAFVIFPTSVAAIAFARAATPDMLFATGLALAMVSADAVLRERGFLKVAATQTTSIASATNSAPSAIPLATNTPHASAIGPLIFFGACLGAATLAKGPAAIILAGGAIGLWAVATRHWKAAFGFFHPLAISGFAIVAVPWYALCAMRNPDFLRTFLWLHNFERYVSPVFQHKQPFWFFGPIMLMALLPWTLLLWLVGADGIRLWREKSWQHSPGFFIACWGIFPVAFFSLSQSKLPSYILPAIPAVCLCVAIALARRLTAKGELVGILLMPAATICAVVAGTAVHNLSAGIPAIPRTIAPTVITIEVVLAVVAMIAASSTRRKLISVAASALSVCVVLMAVLVLPISSAIPTTRELADELRPAAAANRLFLYEADRSCIFGIQFYLDRVLPEWRGDAAPATLSVITTRTAAAALNEKATILSLDHLQSKCVVAEVTSPRR